MELNLDKIKELAKARDLKIKDVYAGIQIAQTTLDQQIRKKNIDLQSYVRICRFFNVPLDYFIDDESLVKNNVNTLDKPTSNFSTISEKCDKCEEKERTINVQGDMISTQKAMITLLQKENSKLKKENEALSLTMQKTS